MWLCMDRMQGPGLVNSHTHEGFMDPELLILNLVATEEPGWRLGFGM